MVTQIESLEEFNDYKENKRAVLFYFSHDECNVCKVLKPQLIELINSEFNNIEFAYINIKKSPEIAAQKSLFTVPTILVYLEGREFLRKSRNLSLTEFKHEISRPYQLLFT